MRRQRGRRHARGLVGDDPDRRPAARLVHHRAGGDDHLRAAAGPPVLRPASRATRLKYATLGLLFVNVSIGGTLTHFAAPPVLMVARPWGWDTAFMLAHFGWRARHRHRRVDVASTSPCSGESCAALASRAPAAGRRAAGRGRSRESACCPCLPGSPSSHLAFMAWTVVNAHYPALFIGGFLFFLGFARATAAVPEPGRAAGRPCSSASSWAGSSSTAGCRPGGSRRSWARLSETPLFVSRDAPDRLQRQRAHHLPRDARAEPGRWHEDRGCRRARWPAADSTVIANAPNPAGQALLGTVLRPLDPSDRAPARCAGADSHRGVGVPPFVSRPWRGVDLQVTDQFTGWVKRYPSPRTVWMN